MEKIIGHEDEIKILDKIVSENKVAHAYLFSGKEGIGKKLVATYFAKRLVDNAESSIEIIESENDMIKVEEIRNLITNVYLKPTDSSRKVAIINDAEKMNSNAQNALLKVLEEPPFYATLILITSNKEKIIKTILSRVTEIKFNSLSNDEIKTIVGEDVDYTFARGSAKKAFETYKNKSIDFSKELATLFDKKDFIEINRKMNEIKSDDINLTDVLEYVKTIYYNDLQNDTNRKITIINLIDEALRALSRNANEDLTTDKLTINICRLN